jgi:hypothetical protein
MVPQCGIAMEELFKAQAQKDYTPIYWFREEEVPL